MASLNGTTPAATYPSLLKFDNNSAISAALRLLSDGNGGATPLYLSSTQLNIGGTGLINSRIGIKGTGTTNATNSFLSENSTNTSSFKIADDGTVTTNQPAAGSNYNYILFQRGGTNWITFGAQSGSEGLYKTGSLYLDATQQSILRGTNSGGGTPVSLINASTTANNGAIGSSGSHILFGSIGVVAHSAGGSPVESSVLKINNNISITAGSNNSFVNIFESRPTINQTGGTVNVVGYTYNPTLTAILGAHYGVLIKPTNTLNGIGLGATMPTATLHLKGSGISSATINFKAENSDATKQITFDDAGNLATNGQFAIGQTTAPNAAAVLELVSTTKGFLPPRMTTVQKNAIATPAAGLMVYDTTLNKLCVFTTAWQTITSV